MGIIPNLLEPSQKQVALYLCAAHIILACSTLGSCHAKGHCRKCSIGPVFGQILSCTSYGNCENDWTPRAQGMKTRKKNHEVNFLNVQKNIKELDPMRPSQVTGWRCCRWKQWSYLHVVRGGGSRTLVSCAVDRGAMDPGPARLRFGLTSLQLVGITCPQGSLKGRAHGTCQLVAMAKGQPNHRKNSDKSASMSFFQTDWNFSASAFSHHYPN
jgi:hypothetical protein